MGGMGGDAGGGGCAGGQQVAQAPSQTGHDEQYPQLSGMQWERERPRRAALPRSEMGWLDTFRAIRVALWSTARPRTITPRRADEAHADVNGRSLG